MIDEDYRLMTIPPAIPSGTVSIVAAAIAVISIYGSPADGYMVPVPTGPAQIVSAGTYQRSFSAPPETGTLVTPAPDQAWTALTSVNVDPTSGINKVINSGNLYQCIQSGITASVGGPTGTSTSITDGTAKWIYLGIQNSYTTIGSSQLIGISARGTQSTATSVPPFDNDSGGSYTQIFNTDYNGFPDSFAGIWYRNSLANNKTNLSGELIWGGTSPGSGAGDEATHMWVELRGVKSGTPHASSNVERASATANICSAAPITTTVPCLIFSVWFGNGNVITTGTSHTAIPLNGLQLIPGANALVSISANGYIQIACAWRLAPPGTYIEQWQTTGEGAQVMVVAFADASTITAADGDEAPYWLLQPIQLQSVITPYVIARNFNDEITTATASVVDEIYWIQPTTVVGSNLVVSQFFDQGELPQSTSVDEIYWYQATIPTPIVNSATPIFEQNELPLSLLVDETHWAQPQFAQSPIFQSPVFDQSDFVSNQQSTVVDEDYWSIQRTQDNLVSRLSLFDQDEFPSIVLLSEIDEDYWFTLRSLESPSTRFILSVQDELPTLSGIDEDYWSSVQLATVAVVTRLFVDQDDLPQLSIIDELYWLRYPITLTNQIILSAIYDDSGFIFTPASPIIDDEYIPRFRTELCIQNWYLWQFDDTIGFTAPPIPPLIIISAAPQIGKSVTLLTPTANISIQQNTQLISKDRSITVGSEAESGAFSRVDDLSAIGIVTTENIK